MAERKSKGQEWLSSILVVLALFLIGCDEQSKRQLGALKQIASVTRLYPAFKQVHSYEASKIGDAILILCYQSSAGYDSVKQFYSQTLPADGWMLLPEKERPRGVLQDVELLFRKGEYQIAIQPEGQDPRGCNYAVTFLWERR